MRRDDDDNTSNLLLDTIRKELESIIDEGPENVLEGTENNLKALITSQTSPVLQLQNVERDDYFSQESGVEKARFCWAQLEETNEISSSSRSSSFFGTHNALSIDEDLRKMHLNLNESYDIFQSVGESFENINFGCLKSRIKDLHLNDRSSESIKTIVNDLKNSFDEKFMENRLNDLTKEVTTKFRNHPGEFGDIPELSEFFRSCTRLQHGLDTLRKQRNEVQALSKHMTKIAEVSYDRVKDIQQKLEIERNNEFKDEE